MLSQWSFFESYDLPCLNDSGGFNGCSPIRMCFFLQASVARDLVLKKRVTQSHLSIRVLEIAGSTSNFCRDANIQLDRLTVNQSNFQIFPVRPWQFNIFDIFCLDSSTVQNIGKKIQKLWMDNSQSQE